jgi:hypothetical protein
MKIDPAGYPFIGGALVPAAVAVAARRPALATSLALLGGFFAYFFRDTGRCRRRGGSSFRRPTAK